VKRKIRGIVVIVIICLLGIAIASGLAYAADNLSSGGQATVQVTESITVTPSDSPSIGTWVTATNTWAISTPDAPVYPNDTGTETLLLENGGDMPVTVTVAVVPTLYPGSDYSADGVSMTIADFDDADYLVGASGSVSLTLAGGDSATLTLTFSAGNGAVAGNYAYSISISR